MGGTAEYTVLYQPVLAGEYDVFVKSDGATDTNDSPYTMTAEPGALGKEGTLRCQHG